MQVWKNTSSGRWIGVSAGSSHRDIHLRSASATMLHAAVRPSQVS